MYIPTLVQPLCILSNKLLELCPTFLFFGLAFRDTLRRFR